MISADKLDVEQKHFLFEEINKDSNFWIKGFPGSGKSVLLVHSIVTKLKENPSASVCVVVFTHSLIQMFSAGMKELGMPEKNIHVTTYHQFRKGNTFYDYIFCDEVQDLTKSVLKCMRDRTKRLIVAGDSNQSIYTCDPQTREGVVDGLDIQNVVFAKPYELSFIHRLSRSTINVISNLVPQMNILSSKTDRTKKDISVRLCKGTTEKEEVMYIVSQADEAISLDESVAILLPTHDDIVTFINIVLKMKTIKPWQKVLNRWNRTDFHNLNRYLHSNSTNIEYIGNGAGSLFNCVQFGKMIVMTYHSVKGLDFDNVFLPFLTNKIYIRDKTLFAVGLTRSKNNLYLSYSGTLHPFLKDLEDECTKIDIANLTVKDNDVLDFDF